MTTERKRRVAAETARRNFTTHGLSGHPLYDTWRKMFTRCGKRPGYRENGIKVYEPWHDIHVFVAWVERNLGPRPRGASLDRIDNDDDYEPGNVKWSDAKEQANNRGHGIIRPDCLCKYDCKEFGSGCSLDSLPWEEASRGVAIELQRRRGVLRALRKSLQIAESLHTGNYDDCVACARQDPYSLDVLLMGDLYTPANPWEWCSAGRGLPRADPYVLSSLMPSYS